MTDHPHRPRAAIRPLAVITRARARPFLFAAIESTRDERVDVAAQVLHERRHRLGYGQVCDSCRDDVRAVLEAVQRR